MSSTHKSPSREKSDVASFTRRNIIKMAGAAGIGTIATGEAAGQKEGSSITDPATDVKKPLSLWYRQPASEWETEALPLGNGRMGAMVFGKPQNERIQLNEETIWANEGADHTNPGAGEYLGDIQQLLLANEHQDAEAVAADHFMAEPLSIDSYQSLGDLSLEFDHGSVEDYQRELDLDAGVIRVGYTVDGTRYTREYFLSAADDILAVRLETDGTDEFGLSASMERQEGAKTLADGQDYVLRGNVQDSGPQLAFEGRLRIISGEGDVTVTDDQLSVTGTDAVTLLFTAATGHGTDESPAQITKRKLNEAERPYPKLRQAHFEDYRDLFRRVNLELKESIQEPIPTDERLAAVQNGATDKHLTELYYQYGRYLLMGSSRSPGMLPANLQGIWNKYMSAPWNSDYHFNINFEMNYWHADICNLSECVDPMINYVGSLRKSGQNTAKVHYNAEGTVVHHLSDIWGFTAPADGVRWGLWPTGAAWLCRNLWEHYRKTGDEETLSEAMAPFVTDAARFMLDFLIEDKEGHLVTAPSKSPENSFIGPDGRATICVGPTMDIGLLQTLFNFCLEEQETLGIDNSMTEEISNKLPQLPPYQIGKYGQLQEWIEQYEETNPGHRHFSHLYPFHPGDQITLRESPILATAARNAIERRMEYGSGHTGWSRAWVVNLWARFEEGEKAYHHLQELYRQSTVSNLFDMHPPFQIDGNFGGTAGITEMLVQDHAGEISLLPALPDAWKNGQVTGLKVRDGFEVDVKWENGEIKRAAIHSLDGNKCRIRTHKDNKLSVTNDWSPGEGRPPWAGKGSDDSTEWYWRPGKGKPPWTVDVNRPKPQVIEFDTEAGQTIPLKAASTSVPELSIDAEAVSVNTVEDGAKEISIPVRNTGTAPSSPTTVKLVNVAPEAIPVLGEPADVPELSTGEVHEASFTLDFGSMPVGKYRIWSVIDPDNKVGETDPGDNVVDIMEIDNGPDLEITPDGITVVEKSSSEIALSVTVNNTGNRGSAPTTLRIQNVTNKEPSVLAEGVQVSSIEPVGSETVEVSVDVNQEGSHVLSLQAIVDPGNEIKEVEEKDNAATISVVLAEPVQSPYATFSNVTSTTTGAIGDDGFFIECTGGELWANADEYSTIYLDDEIESSDEIVTKVTSFDTASSFSKAGLILRNDVTKPGQSTGYTVLYLFPNEVRIQWDTDGDGYVQTVASGGSYELPLWIKISKEDTEITGYYSNDGSNWTEIGSAVVSSVNAVQDAGVFVSSNSGDPTQGVFREVELGSNS